MAKELNYSVYVISINYVSVKDFLNTAIWVKVKVAVRSQGFTYEAYGIAPTLMQSEDLAKKRALKLIGCRYYIKS